MRCNRQALLDYAADRMDLDLISEFADHLATCSYCSSELLRIKRAGNAAAYRKRPPSAEVKPFVPSPDRKEDLVEYLREHPDPEVRELTVSEARHRFKFPESPEEATTFIELPDEALEEIPESTLEVDFAHDEPAAEPEIPAAPHLNNDIPAEAPANQEEDMEPTSNAEKTIQGGAKTVKLRSGGTVTLSSTAGLFELSAQDRDFVFGLADLMVRYQEGDQPDLAQKKKPPLTIAKQKSHRRGGLDQALLDALRAGGELRTTELLERVAALTQPGKSGQSHVRQRLRHLELAGQVVGRTLPEHRNPVVWRLAGSPAAEAKTA